MATKKPRVYLSTTEAGELLELDPNTVERACRSGALVPDVRIGRVKGFTERTLLAWRKRVRPYTRQEEDD